MSSAATALSALGAQILQADLDDPVSLTHSLASAHAVFLVTDFWSCPDPAGSREKQQAMRALGILAQSPVLEHLILSSLPSIRDISGGKYTNVVHFDGKAEVVRWLEETYEGLWKKTTVLWVGSYMQLWKQFPVAFGPEKTEEGVWRLRSTFNEDTKLPLVDVSDTGKAVRGILEKSIKVMKKTVGLVGEDNISVTEQLILWGKSVGAEVDYIQISEQEDMERAKQTTGFDEYLLRDLVEVKLAFRNYEGKLVHGEGIVQAKDVCVASHEPELKTNKK